MKILIKDIIKTIENFAPLYYQESYDNAGVQVGDVNAPLTGILVALDITPEVVDEAIAKNKNCIIAHHPLIFSGIKKITGKNDIEKCIIKAIQHNIVLYAAHTNLDNMYLGVNKVIADRLGLIHTSILAPSTGHALCKFICYVPLDAVESVKQAIFSVGGGHIGNYSECSFATQGSGTFKPDESARPKVGKSGGKRETVAEMKLEVLIPEYLSARVLDAVRAVGYYEEVAYELLPLSNTDHFVGAGYCGELEQAMTLQDFLKHLKECMQPEVIKYTHQHHASSIKKVAVCGGSGSFLLGAAKAQGADIFITADYKYHQFFDAGEEIVIADIGHYESEIYTSDLLVKILSDKFPDIAVEKTTVYTNPVRYFY